MSGRFYPELGREAWPGGCPSCGAEVVEYDDEYEGHIPGWEFECGCIVALDPGCTIFSDEPCPEAMNRHLDSVILCLSDPSPLPGAELEGSRA